MKKFINSPENLIDDMINGFIKSFGKDYRKLPDYNGIIYNSKKEKVSIITGGGSAGEPWCIGACGEGMADAIAVGDVFSAPAATIINALCREVYNGKGILMITGNHTGDLLNFELGRELFLFDNKIQCELLLVTDEMTSAPGSQRNMRRALSAIPVVVFIAAAAADAGLPLYDVHRIAKKANDNISTISATLDLSVNPINGKPLGQIPADEVVFGMGVTGEPGILTEKYKGERATTQILLDRLIDDLELKENDEVSVFINGFGGVSQMESLIIAGTAVDYLYEKNMRIFDVDVCDKLKIQTTNAISVTLIKMDEELKKYYSGKAFTPLMHKYHCRGLK